MTLPPTRESLKRDFMKQYVLNAARAGINVPAVTLVYEASQTYDMIIQGSKE